MNENIFLIDKPVGMSSFDVIRHLRKVKGNVKMGHAGTLDPLASGLLIVGVGKGTKQLHKLSGLPKVYESDVLVGVSTTTDDREGDIEERVSVESLDIQKVDEVLSRMEGILHLSVPLYSAVKKDGKPLYRYAREGREVEIPKRDMEVIQAARVGELLVVDGGVRVPIRFEVASGVYIRSLAREFGRRLGYPASVWSLRRTSIGRYSIHDAITLDEL